MPRKRKPSLIKFSMKDVRRFGPCYDPIKYIPETWNGTVVDVLKMKNVPPQDKLWVVCREELLDEGLLRRFAVAQAKTCRKHVQNKKEFDRILKVCINFVEGKATKDDLNAAYSAAASAAYSAAWSAAESAAYSAAASAAYSAAWSAAWSAAESAASAASTAESAAESAAVKMLIKMVYEFYSKE
jgi:hypothetical protein